MVNGSLVVCTNKAIDKQAARRGWGGREMKARRVKREGSRGGEAAERRMMNYYKGEEKSKWK